jgi:AcrR family transcriptional regulator
MRRLTPGDISPYAPSSEMTASTAGKRQYRMVARAEAAAATAERVLAAAWRQFAERPYDDVRLAGIARDAGVTVQTLHSRFGTKDELFVAAWGWQMSPEGARRDAAPVGDVRTAVRVLYDSYEDGGDAALRLIAQEDRIPAVLEMTDAGRAWHRAWVERTFAPLLQGLRGAARERRLVALVVATDLLVWKLLRREMGLDRRTAERIVIEMVTATKGAP